MSWQVISHPYTSGLTCDIKARWRQVKECCIITFVVVKYRSPLCSYPHQQQFESYCSSAAVQGWQILAGQRRHLHTCLLQLPLAASWWGFDSRWPHILWSARWMGAEPSATKFLDRSSLNKCVGRVWGGWGGEEFIHTAMSWQKKSRSCIAWESWYQISFNFIFDQAHIYCLCIVCADCVAALLRCSFSPSRLPSSWWMARFVNMQESLQSNTACASRTSWTAIRQMDMSSAHHHLWQRAALLLAHPNAQQWKNAVVWHWDAYALAPILFLSSPWTCLLLVSALLRVWFPHLSKDTPWAYLQQSSTFWWNWVKASPLLWSAAT